MFDPQAARERGEAAIPAPWTLRREADGGPDVEVMSEQTVIAAMGDFYPEAEFVAHARSDLPAALEALEEAQAHLKTVRWVLEMDDPRLLKALQTIERLLKERDGYAAQSKRRGEALEKVVSRWQSYRSETLPGRTRNQDLGYCAEDMKEIARDAIAISPEQAKEKEQPNETQ